MLHPEGVDPQSEDLFQRSYPKQQKDIFRKKVIVPPGRQMPSAPRSPCTWATQTLPTCLGLGLEHSCQNYILFCLNPLNYF